MRHAGRKDAFAEFATIIYRHFLVNALLIFSLTLAHSTGQKRDLVSNETVRALAGQPPASSLDARRRSVGMDMCFACHRTILLGLSWTSNLARSAGSDPEGSHAPVGSTWSNAILTS